MISDKAYETQNVKLCLKKRSEGKHEWLTAKTTAFQQNAIIKLF